MVEEIIITIKTEETPQEKPIVEKPDDPIQPDEPKSPISPDETIQPDLPTQPGLPIQPDEPTLPLKTELPLQPDDPIQPNEPIQPKELKPKVEEIVETKKDNETPFEKQEDIEKPVETIIEKQIDKPEKTKPSPIDTPAKKTKEVVSKASKAVDSLASPKESITNTLVGLISKHPAILTAIGGVVVTKKVIDALFAPGGPFDTRFRLEIDKQINALEDRTKTREIKLGKQTIRVTTAAGLGDKAGSYDSNQARLRKGITTEIDINSKDSRGIA